jgi:hypothetical protein
VCEHRVLRLHPLPCVVTAVAAILSERSARPYFRDVSECVLSTTCANTCRGKGSAAIPPGPRYAPRGSTKSWPSSASLDGRLGVVATPAGPQAHKPSTLPTVSVGSVVEREFPGILAGAEGSTPVSEHGPGKSPNIFPTDVYG